MRKHPFILPLLLLCHFSWMLGTAVAEPPPTWIWLAGPREAHTEISITRSFAIPDDLERATLRLAADFCGVRLHINDHLASTLEPYDDLAASEVTRLLHKGENRIDLVAKGVAGPSAVAVQIEGVRKDGKPWSLASGPDWKARPAEGDLDWQATADFGEVSRLAWQKQGTLPDIGAFDEYNQWKEALGEGENSTKATFSELPDGFALELLRTSQGDEGSWVSMAFDAKGRIILAREKRGLLRATLAEDKNSITDVAVIDDTLLECRGLLFAHGSLYANANNSKALYRLRENSGDDTFDEITLLKGTGGSVGHGRNDLALGPDGMIYAIHGDSVEIPGESKFHTPPTAEKFPFEGHLVRTDPDAKTWEIVATGLRNPFGIDFNPKGEAFTYDADNESDIGLPFYRPTRVNHLVSGADYGWRQGGQSWPAYAPDSVPTTIDIGHGSPTAVKFGTHSNFPTRYRDALFILDWAYGRIIAVDTIPHGASYICRAHTFLRGRPLNVTDLDFGPDGAMYFITGGRKTRSALYRIRFAGESDAPPPLSRQEVDRAEFSTKSRGLRRTLERFHHPEISPEDFSVIWSELNHADPWVRHAARTALEHQPFGGWKGRALTEPNPKSAATALMALARVASEDVLSEIVGRLVELDFENLTPAFQLAVVRGYDICRRRKCPTDGETVNRIVRQIGPVFPSSYRDLNRELARMLLEFGVPGALPKTLDLMVSANHQPDQLYYLDVLSRAGDNPAWTNAHRETYFRFLKIAPTFSGDLSLPGFVNGIRERALASLGDDERENLAHLIEREGKRNPVPEPKEPAREIVKNWTVADLEVPAENPPGNRFESIERGREIFTSALCSRCHQVGHLGTPVGPNLSAVSSRFSRRDLLKAIVEPSSVVAEIYQSHIVTKKDGGVIMGRLIQNNLRESTFTIAPDPFAPWLTEEIPKNEIGSREISPVSPMPAGLLNTFSREDIRDLITFLEAGGQNPKSSP